MITNQRVFYKDNTVLSDLSVNLSDYNAGTVSLNITAAEDAIYLASIMPWNNRYFDLSTVNTIDSSLIIETWDGNAFKSSFDLIDETKANDKTLAQSGLVRFTPDKDISWVREHESFTIGELSTTYVLNMYWTKITFTQDCAFELNYIGQKFATDQELYSYYPDLNKAALLSQYEAGKTSWDQQHFMAANAIARDLLKRNIAYSDHQIMNPDAFIEAAVHKCAGIIYGAFGEGYRDDMALAMKAYDNAMNLNYYNVDSSMDGRLNLGERFSSTRYFTR